MTIPLAHRLPNAPPEFVGRAWERKHLRDALTRRRIAVVRGLGGLGKTALALETIHQHFAARVESAIYVGLQQGDDDVRVRVIRALAECRATTTPIEWRALLSDPDSLVASAIDLADVGDHWIVIDDLQWTNPLHAKHLLTHVTRFARRSRWLVITREDPGIADLASETLALEAMPSPDLGKLAAIWAPRRSRVELQRAVDSAGGSPWQLRSALFGKPTADTSARDVLADLAPASRSLILSLAEIDTPISLETLARFADLPATEEFDALERRGLVERTPRGWRLHDVARAIVGERRHGAPDLARLADTLLADADSRTAFEGARLLGKQRRIDDLVTALDARGADWLARGYATELWRLIDALPHATSSALARWRLRATVEFDHREVLAAVREPEQSTPVDRLAWARVLFRRGRVEDAARLSSEVANTARGAADRSVAFDAALLHAGATAQQGREREALGILGVLVPPDDGAGARLDALAAMLHTALDEREAARKLVASLLPRLDSLDGAAQLEAAFGVAQTFYFLGQYREADDVFRDLVARRGEETLALYHGRRLLYYRACIAIERGHFRDARDLIARLDPFAPGRSMFRAFVDYAACMLQLAEGRFDSLPALAAHTVALGRELGEWNPHHVEAILLEARVAMSLGREPSLPDEHALPAEGYPARIRVGLHRLDAALRRGETIAREQWPVPAECPAWGDTRAIASAVRARAALLAGEIDEAARLCTSMIEHARDSGSAVLESEAWLLRGDIAIVAGEANTISDTATWLQRFGRDAPAPRFEAEGDLLAVSVRDGFDAAVLERIATRRHESPRAARRAAAMLGEEVLLDALDRLVVTSTTRLHSAVRVASVSRVGSAAWGIDSVGRSVWTDAGERISFADKPLLFRVLEVLAQRGGRATKEDLVREVWSEREYNKLEHDNRLRLSARKLRRSIERDPEKPQRLLTTEDGYALGGRVRWVSRSA